MMLARIVLCLSALAVQAWAMSHSGGEVMAFGPLAYVGLGLGAKLLGGGDKQKQSQNSTTTNMRPEAAIPEQMGLLQALISGMSGGGGEFGFGNQAMSANKTLLGALGSRGISPNSGVATSALSQMLGTAQAGDAEARRRYALSLIGARPAMYSPGSTTTGQAEAGQGGLQSMLGLGSDLLVGKGLGLF